MFYCEFKMLIWKGNHNVVYFYLVHNADQILGSFFCFIKMRAKVTFEQ